jgi:DNA (cytosine-5)-methyltransferase 1
MGNGFGCSVFDGTGVARTLRLLSQGRQRNPHQQGQRKKSPASNTTGMRQTHGYPDTFQIPVSDTQAYRQFGNSVAVPVVTALAGAVVGALRQPPARLVQSELPNLLGS